MRSGTDSDRVLLEHILQCIKRVRDYSEGDRATFFGSHMVQDAVVRNVQTLAESTQRPSEPLRLPNPPCHGTRSPVSATS